MMWTHRSRGHHATMQGVACHRRALEWGLLAGLLLTGRPVLAQEDGIEEIEEIEGETVEPSSRVPSGGRQIVSGENDETILIIEELPPGEGVRRDPDTPPAGQRAYEQLARIPQEYALRLMELEDQINQLKEEIFRTKSRLLLLREQVLRSSIAGCQAVISHVNDMSAAFSLEQVVYSLDGNRLFMSTGDERNLGDQDEFEVYNGAVLPGPHNLSVEMIFVGNGFGVFNYMEGYRFRLRSSYAFTAEDGRVAHLNVIAYEEGGINQPIEERPTVRYEIAFSDTEEVED